MLKSYLKTTLRTAYNHPFFTAINITALALSMSVCLIVLSIIKNQFDYDNFNSESAYIYRVGTKVNTTENTNDRYATSPIPLAHELKNNFGFITNTATIRPLYGANVSFNYRSFRINGAFATKSLFDIFSLALMPNSDLGAFNSPNKIIINTDIAHKVFHDQNPIGNTVKFEGLGSFLVVGVFNEKAHKSHLHDSFYLSFESIPTLEKQKNIPSISDKWNNYSSNYTYIKINTLSEAGLTSALNSFSIGKRKVISYNSNERSYDFFSQHLNDITPTRGVILENSRGLSYTSIILFSLIVIALLLIASFNYASLTIARALTRSKEIGTRKLLGASKADVFLQFLSESIIIAMLSSLIALVIIPFIPLNYSLQTLFYDVKVDITLIFYFIIFSVLSGCLAGLLPGLIFSRYKLLQMMKNVLDTKLFKGSILKKALIVIQFSFSTIFLFVIIVLHKQSNFMANGDYGFNTENIINVRLSKNINYQTMVNDFKNLPGVQRISAISGVFGVDPPQSLKVKGEQSKNSMDIDFYSIDSSVINNFQLKLLAGENFNKYNTLLQTDGVIINQKALDILDLGNPGTAIGKYIFIDDTTRVQVKGVVKDFHYQNFKSPITPLLLIDDPKLYNYFNIKVRPNDVSATTNKLRQVWNKDYPNIEFEYEDYNKSFRTQQGHNDDVLMLSFISGMLLSISVLGLLGMAAFNVETKLKEMSIRKILGANPWDILFILSSEFMKLVIIAGIIGIPIGYVMGTSFLNGFSYKISIGIGTILGTIVIIITLGAITLCSQTLKSSFSSPLKNIRND